MARSTGSREAFTVALVGPDGAGKSTVAHRLQGELGRPATVVYMGVNPDSSTHLLPSSRLIRRLRAGQGAQRRDAQLPSASPSSSRGGSGAARRVLRAGRSLVGLANRIAEELYRQGVAWVGLRQGRIVIFDRHFFTDFHASDVKPGKNTFARRVHGWFLRNVYPRPDLVIYLDAPAAVLLARKGEGTETSLEQMRTDFRAAAEDVRRFVVVDATQPLDAVVRDVRDAVIAESQRRSSGRSRSDVADGTSSR